MEDHVQASPGSCLRSLLHTGDLRQPPHLSRHSAPWMGVGFRAQPLSLRVFSGPVQAASLSHADAVTEGLCGTKPCARSRGSNTKQDSLLGLGSFWAFAGFPLGTLFRVLKVCASG